MKDGSWIYSENKKVVEPIQDWVNRVVITPTLFMQNDHYGALVVVACNENRCELTSPLPGVAVYYPVGIVGGVFNEHSIVCTR